MVVVWKCQSNLCNISQMHFPRALTRSCSSANPYTTYSKLAHVHIPRLVNSGFSDKNCTKLTASSWYRKEDLSPNQLLDYAISVPEKGLDT
jgi:hypothetical protein